MRILAVDDDPVILDLLRHALTKHDHYDLVCCESAEEAQHALNADLAPFDCFLLDVMLPGVDGIELCEIVRKTKQYRITPIIMITGSRAPELMGRAFYAGATDFVSKPLDGVELGARINSAGMLNESLRREREAQHTLAELAALTKIRYGEAINLTKEGITNFATLENDLLRMKSGCYGMNLICIDVIGLRGIYRNVESLAFRHHLIRVAEATTGALGDETWKLAYLGSGRFIGLTLGRTRINHDALQDEMNALLNQDWDAQKSGTPSPATIRLTAVSDRRLWSGVSASDALRKHLTQSDILEETGSEREENLFAKFDQQIAAE